MVSVVILTNKMPTKVLECLKKQTYRDFEIILASEKGIVNAMNCALKAAKGDILVRLDDDAEMPENWLQGLVEPFSDPSVGGVTGPTFVPKERRGYRDSIRWAENPKGILKWLYDGNAFKPAGIRECGCVSYDSNYEKRFLEWAYTGKATPRPDHLEGTNWAMRTELIRAVGGFDPKFDGVCEWFDDDVVFKVKKLGHRLAYNPRAYLYHLLEKGSHYNERFEGWGRIKNFMRFHWRHCRWRFLKLKFWVYLMVWGGYFVWKRFQK